MKLKTLKDISSSCMLRGEKCCIPDYVIELKKEAIKWVKELRRKTGTTGRIDYRLSFKEFFNITEEDLK